MLFGAEDTVSGIAKTRDDIALIIQVIVHSCSVNIHIRMRFGQSFEPLWCAYQVEAANLTTAVSLKNVNDCNK